MPEGSAQPRLATRATSAVISAQSQTARGNSRGSRTFSRNRLSVRKKTPTTPPLKAAKPVRDCVPGGGFCAGNSWERQRKKVTCGLLCDPGLNSAHPASHSQNTVPDAASQQHATLEQQVWPGIGKMRLYGSLQPHPHIRPKCLRRLIKVVDSTTDPTQKDSKSFKIELVSVFQHYFYELHLSIRLALSSSVRVQFEHSVSALP